MLTLSDTVKLVEAILFIENEPMTIEKLTQLTGASEIDILKAIASLELSYEEGSRGLILAATPQGYQFTPSNKLHEHLRSVYGKRVDKRLTRAALETLSIIAYSQPVTRRDVENIRGVSSDSIMRMLLEREYIHVVGRKDVPGHPGLYGTTKKFLLHFGLKSISDLPRLSELDRERFLQNEEERV